MEIHLNIPSWALWIAGIVGAVAVLVGGLWGLVLLIASGDSDQ
jgi:hypothetical protein